MATSNPFKLEMNNKKFFLDLAKKSELQSIPEYSLKKEKGSNRIKNMNDQLQQLAKKREQVLFKDTQMDYIFKKEKPIIGLGDFITGIRSNNQYELYLNVSHTNNSEKKQSIHEFLEKKKQIYLSKMNINIKKQETNKLEDYIKDQEETLKARKLYFENDVQFMQRFIEGIKKNAQDAQNAVQNQLKIQESLVSRLNALQTEGQKVDNAISKDTQILSNLKTYKKFIDSFYNSDRNWKPYVRKRGNDEIVFMTQNAILDSSEPSMQSLIIRFQPENLLEIFNNAEENNIREIQNLHDKEDQVDMVVKHQKKEKDQFMSIMKQNEERISLINKQLENKQYQSYKLKELKKNNANRISILDNDNLDIDKVKSKILQIFKQINPKKAAQLHDNTQRSIKKLMGEIQHEIEKLRFSIQKQKQNNPNLAVEVQKQIKQNQKKQNLLRKQEESKQLQLKKQRQQGKKWSEVPSQKPAGRKDMAKVIIEKKVVKKKQVNIKNIDDSEKYLTYD